MANQPVALTDTASQIAELQRRQKLAEALAAQAGQPIEVQSYKGIQAPISPFSVLAKVLDSYTSKKQMADAVKSEKEARKTARDEAVGFLQNLDKTATPNLVAPTGAPEMINTGVPMADFTPASGSIKDMRKQLGTTPDEIAAAKNFVPPAQPVQAAQPPIMQAPGIDGNMAGAPMVRAVPGPVDNAPARMSMANAPTIQAPQLYGNEQAPVEVNTPQQKMAMLMQAQISGNPYLEQMAPAMKGEIKAEANAKKVFDAIGDVSKEYGGDPRIMAGIVAAGDPNAGIDYLMKLGASNADAKREMAKLEFTTKATAAEHREQEQFRHDENESNRITQLLIAQGNHEASRAIAEANRQGRPAPIMPFPVQNDLAHKGQLADSADRAFSNFNDRFVGHPVTGDVGVFVNRLTGKDKEAANWWQDYKDYQAEIMHDRYGGALTPGETQRYKAYSVSPNMNPAVAKENLRLQNEIIQTALARKAKASLVLGYDPSAVSSLIGRDPTTMSIVSPGSPSAPIAATNIPALAITALQGQPNLAAAFDAKYGAGEAKKILGK